MLLLFDVAWHLGLSKLDQSSSEMPTVRALQHAQDLSLYRRGIISEALRTLQHAGRLAAGEEDHSCNSRAFRGKFMYEIMFRCGTRLPGAALDFQYEHKGFKGCTRNCFLSVGHG